MGNARPKIRRAGRTDSTAGEDACRYIGLWVGVVMVLLGGCTPEGPRSLLQGKKLVEKGKYSEAIESLTNATALLGTNAQAWNYLGLAYHYAGKAADAETAYRRAVLRDHDLSEARYNLGCLLLEQNKPELARTELIAFTLRRGNVVEGFLKLGTAQLGAREASGATAAEKSFQEALRLNPQSPEALNGMGMVRYQQRRYGDAQQYFMNALRQRPNFAPAILNLGILFQARLQDNLGALQRYRQYLALKPRPENAEAVTEIVRQLEQEMAPRPVTQPPGANGATQAVLTAKAAASKAAAKNVSTQPAATTGGPVTSQIEISKVTTNAPRAATNLVVPAAKGEKEAGTNTQLSSKAGAKPVSGNRAEAERLFAQGSEAQKAHRLVDAMAAYRAATQLDPGYFEAHYNLGLAATEAGNVQTALTAYQNALALVPDSLEARYNLGLLLKQGGNNAEAASEFEKVLQKYPNDARTHLALGNLYAQQLPNPSRAREHYLKVLELDPHYAQADLIRRWIAEHSQ